MTDAVAEYNTFYSKDKITLKLQKIGDRPSGQLPDDLPLIQHAMSAAKLFGVDPKLSCGSTNASIPISKGIPAICIWRGGDRGGAHSLQEWFINKEGAKAIKLALLITLAQAGTSEESIDMDILL